MFLVTSNKVRRLLYMSYIGQVHPAEVAESKQEVRALLSELPQGFCLLADLSQLVTMDLDCLPEIGNIMELLDQAGVNQIVRVIPAPEQDIGFNILTIFHYPHHPRITTFKSLAEAGKHLEIDH